MSASLRIFFPFHNIFCLFRASRRALARPLPFSRARGRHAQLGALFVFLRVGSVREVAPAHFWSRAPRLFSLLYLRGPLGIHLARDFLSDFDFDSLPNHPFPPYLIS